MNLSYFKSLLLQSQIIKLQDEVAWGYSSVVEHSTADREVPGSNPGVPYSFFLRLFRHYYLKPG